MKQRGITLLEMMLVLAIGSVFFIVSMRLYTQYAQQTNQYKLLANVNQLFQAMEKYYQSNCRQRYDINGTAVSDGKLDPAVTSANPVVLSIPTDLVNTGFLTSWHPNNLLVDNTPTEQGYYVQFNRMTPDQTMSVFACTGTGDPPTCTTNPQTTALDGTASSTGTPGTSNVVVWRLQVAVKLAEPAFSDAALQTAYQKQMNAVCVSKSSGTTGPVTMCEATPTAGGYLVWERAATFISDTTSNLWISKPITKQFNMQYTNDSMQLLTGSVQTFPNGSSIRSYLCNE